jgi:hypothetical protein
VRSGFLAVDAPDGRDALDASSLQASLTDLVAMARSSAFQRVRRRQV